MTTVKGLKELAKEAYEESSVNADKALGTMMILRKLFGIEPDEVLENGNIVADGVALTGSDLFSGLQVVGICPKCQKECLSVDVYSKQNLWIQIEDFTPGDAHVCHYGDPLERIAAALEKIAHRGISTFEVGL